MKGNYTSTELKIMRVLFQQKVPLTDYQIAKEVGISYQTARKYIDKLIKEEVLIEDVKTGEIKEKHD